MISSGLEHIYLDQFDKSVLCHLWQWRGLCFTISLKAHNRKMRALVSCWCHCSPFRSHRTIINDSRLSSHQSCTSTSTTSAQRGLLSVPWKPFSFEKVFIPLERICSILHHCGFPLINHALSLALPLHSVVVCLFPFSPFLWKKFLFHLLHP
jgi:hypothetical protein